MLRNLVSLPSSNLNLTCFRRGHKQFERENERFVQNQRDDLELPLVTIGESVLFNADPDDK
jgi:hypothetical protein